MLLASRTRCPEEAVLIFVVGELIDGRSGLGVEEFDLSFKVTYATVGVIGSE